MYRYALRRDTLTKAHMGQFVTYGIDVFDGDSRLLRSVPDISPDKEALSHIIQLCNSLQLSFTHLDDVIEDFLATR